MSSPRVTWKCYFPHLPFSTISVPGAYMFLTRAPTATQMAIQMAIQMGTLGIRSHPGSATFILYIYIYIYKNKKLPVEHTRVISLFFLCLMLLHKSVYRPRKFSTDRSSPPDFFPPSVSIRARVDHETSFTYNVCV